jgi:hypothetical protein
MHYASRDRAIASLLHAWQLRTCTCSRPPECLWIEGVHMHCLHANELAEVRNLIFNSIARRRPHSPLLELTPACSAPCAELLASFIKLFHPSSNFFMVHGNSIYINEKESTVELAGKLQGAGPSPAVNRDFVAQIELPKLLSIHASGPGQPCSEFFCEKHPRNFFEKSARTCA